MTSFGTIIRYFVRKNREYLRCILSKKVILVLGDSHVLVFNQPKLKRSFPGTCFVIHSVGGATISGLENPNSKTNCRAIFDRALKTYRCRKKIIVMLGEVDTGFVIWYRATKYNKSVDEMLNKTVSNYKRFIRCIKRNDEVIVISTPLPTIHDKDIGEVASLRKEVTATLRQRTELTTKFNALMKSFCERHGVSYISLDEDSIGEDGLVSSELLNQDASEHHYNPLQYVKLLVPKLSVVLKS